MLFQLNPEIPFPPSLLNIFKRNQRTRSFHRYAPNGDLTRWANQGVFFAQCSHSAVRAQWGRLTSGKRLGRIHRWSPSSDWSHSVKLWVFMLWGNFATKRNQGLIDLQSIWFWKHRHPSPLSFYRRCSWNQNTFLYKRIFVSVGKTPIALVAKRPRIFEAFLLFDCPL